MPMRKPKGKEAGLLKAVALGKNVETTVFGRELHESFDSIQEALTNIAYRRPGTSFEVVRSGARLEQLLKETIQK